MNCEKEAYYFSHDSNARQDEKIIALRMKHGWAGYGLFWAITEKLREASGYMLSTDYNVLSFDLRIDAKTIKTIVEDFQLFKISEDGKKFYSERMMRNMKAKEEKSEKARKSIQKRWENERKKKESNTNVIRTNNESNTNVIRTNNESNTIKVKEKKEKEIDIGKIQTEFYNSLIPFVLEFGKETIREFYDYWSEPNKSKTKIKWQLQKTWDTKRRLQRWTSNDFNGKKQPEPDKKEPYKPEKW